MRWVIAIATYAIASLAAATGVVFATQTEALDIVRGPDGVTFFMQQLLVIILGVWGIFSACAFLLGVPAVILAERWRIRSVFYYVLLGALIGVMSVVSVHLFSPYAYIEDAIPVAQRFAIAGVAVGLIYWLFAGRNAGGPAPVPETAFKTEQNL